MLYVTHDQAEALAVSSRLAVIRDASIEQCGAPADIHERPATPFVAGFVGANVMPGTIQPGGRVVIDGGRLEVGAQDGFAPGVRVAVTIRPERVRVVRGDAGGDNCLSGVVTARRYGGLHSDVRIQVGGREVRARCATQSAPAPGAQVTVVLPVEAVAILPL
jgi:putative spermidine/putrescine transport system ATP-binding protein